MRYFRYYLQLPELYPNINLQNDDPMCQDDKKSDISESFNDSCFQDNSDVSIIYTLKYMLTIMKIFNFVI